MADLEDRILRQNVPGRWTSLSGENDDKRQENDDDNESCDEYVLQMLHSCVSSLIMTKVQGRQSSID